MSSEGRILGSKHPDFGPAPPPSAPSVLLGRHFHLPPPKYPPEFSTFLIVGAGMADSPKTPTPKRPQNPHFSPQNGAGRPQKVPFSPHFEAVPPPKPPIPFLDWNWGPNPPFPPQQKGRPQKSHFPLRPQPQNRHFVPHFLQPQIPFSFISFHFPPIFSLFSPFLPFLPPLSLFSFFFPFFFHGFFPFSPHFSVPIPTPQPESPTRCPRPPEGGASTRPAPFSLTQSAANTFGQSARRPAEAKVTLRNSGAAA